MKKDVDGLDICSIDRMLRPHDDGGVLALLEEVLYIYEETFGDVIPGRIVLAVG